MKQQQLDSWKDGENSTWYMTINETEVKAQLLRKRHKTEEKLKDETSKRKKLQNEVRKCITENSKEASKGNCSPKVRYSVATHCSQKS